MLAHRFFRIDCWKLFQPPESAEAFRRAPVYLLNGETGLQPAKGFWDRWQGVERMPSPHPAFLVEFYGHDFRHLYAIIEDWEPDKPEGMRQSFSFGFWEPANPRTMQRVANKAGSYGPCSHVVARAPGYETMTHDELHMHAGVVMATISVLTASNLQGTQEQLPRMKRMQTPPQAGPVGWEYRIIDVPVAHQANQHLGGTHASPRWHVRRGHERRLANGRVIAVRECEVGDRTRGGIVKDYRVEARP